MESGKEHEREWAKVGKGWREREGRGLWVTTVKKAEGWAVPQRVDTGCWRVFLFKFPMCSYPRPEQTLPAF